MRTLKQIAADHPELTFQNNGYEYINRSKLADRDLKAIEEINEILKSKIEGFYKFFNFKKRESGALVVRVDYVWDTRGFIGVGYFPIEEIDNKTLEN